MRKLEILMEGVSEENETDTLNFLFGNIPFLYENPELRKEWLKRQVIKIWEEDD